MTDKKELNDDELSEVAGGRDTHVKLPAGTFGDVIPKYEAPKYIGKEVYAVRIAIRSQYCWGILQRSYEDPIVKDPKFNQSTTVRTHDIYVTGTAPGVFATNCKQSFDGDDYDLFLKIK